MLTRDLIAVANLLVYLTHNNVVSVLENQWSVTTSPVCVPVP